MRKLATLLTVITLALGGLRADDKPGRAEQLKTIRADLAKAQEDFRKEMKAGTIKPDAEGEYPGWTDLLKRFVKPTRPVIEADPADAVGFAALHFALTELGATDADLFGLVLKHHIANAKIEPLLNLDAAPVDFLRDVAAKSPHGRVRLWARYHQAQQLVAGGKPKEAETLLEALSGEAEAKKVSGYNTGTLADTSGRLLFEIRNLNVGQEAPEIKGPNLDGKPMALSESRGRVTMLVFWATWCRPCMDMVPHERELVERYAGRPFALIGANGDKLTVGLPKLYYQDGRLIDDGPVVQAAVEKNKMTWPSFRNARSDGSPFLAWNVQSWPTIYLLDERGVIRGKWKGDPGAKELDAAVEKLVKAAEAK